MLELLNMLMPSQVTVTKALGLQSVVKGQRQQNHRQQKQRAPHSGAVGKRIKQFPKHRQIYVRQKLAIQEVLEHQHRQIYVRQKLAIQEVLGHQHRRVRAKQKLVIQEVLEHQKQQQKHRHRQGLGLVQNRKTRIPMLTTLLFPLQIVGKGPKCGQKEARLQIHDQLMNDLKTVLKPEAGLSGAMHLVAQSQHPAGVMA